MEKHKCHYRNETGACVPRFVTLHILRLYIFSIRPPKAHSCVTIIQFALRLIIPIELSPSRMFAFSVRTVVCASFRPSRNVLPCSAETSAGASQQAFFLVSLSLFVKLAQVQLRSSEQSGQEYDEEYAQECELCPEYNGTKYWPIESHPIEERRHD